MKPELEYGKVDSPKNACVCDTVIRLFIFVSIPTATKYLTSWLSGMLNG